MPWSITRNVSVQDSSANRSHQINTSSYYAVIQLGYAVFGIGFTQEEALIDAKQWGVQDTVDYTPDTLMGETVLIPCTADFYDAVYYTADVDYDICHDNGLYIADIHKSGAKS